MMIQFFDNPENLGNVNMNYYIGIVYASCK
jgi:hypothetical protein